MKWLVREILCELVRWEVVMMAVWRSARGDGTVANDDGAGVVLSLDEKDRPKLLVSMLASWDSLNDARDCRFRNTQRSALAWDGPWNAVKRV